MPAKIGQGVPWLQTVSLGLRHGSEALVKRNGGHTRCVSYSMLGCSWEGFSSAGVRSLLSRLGTTRWRHRERSSIVYAGRAGATLSSAQNPTAPEFSRAKTCVGCRATWHRGVVTAEPQDAMQGGIADW